MRCVASQEPSVHRLRMELRGAETRRTRPGAARALGAAATTHLPVLDGAPRTNQALERRANRQSSANSTYTGVKMFLKI